jgi:acetolactate synthase-1/3 small subunit
MKNKPDLKDHTISIVVYDKPGVMARITSLITRRGFNIESISAGDAKDKGMYRITIVIRGDDRSIEQIQKQIYKIIDTVKVSPILENNKVEREMALIKVKTNNGTKSDLFQMINIYQASIVDSAADGFVIEIVGPKDKVDGFIELIPKNRILEIARTGIVAMNRLKQTH